MYEKDNTNVLVDITTHHKDILKIMENLRNQVPIGKTNNVSLQCNAMRYQLCNVC